MKIGSFFGLPILSVITAADEMGKDEFIKYVEILSSSENKRNLLDLKKELFIILQALDHVQFKYTASTSLVPLEEYSFSKGELYHAGIACTDDETFQFIDSVVDACVCRILKNINGKNSIGVDSLLSMSEQDVRVFFTKEVRKLELETIDYSTIIPQILNPLKGTTKKIEEVSTLLLEAFNIQRTIMNRFLDYDMNPVSLNDCELKVVNCLLDKRDYIQFLYDCIVIENVTDHNILNFDFQNIINHESSYLYYIFSKPLDACKGRLNPLLLDTVLDIENALNVFRDLCEKRVQIKAEGSQDDPDIITSEDIEEVMQSFDCKYYFKALFENGILRKDEITMDRLVAMISLYDNFIKYNGTDFYTSMGFKSYKDFMNSSKVLSSIGFPGLNLSLSYLFEAALPNYVFNKGGITIKTQKEYDELQKAMNDIEAFCESLKMKVGDNIA